jgi:hypothetical protein
MNEILALGLIHLYEFDKKVVMYKGKGKGKVVPVLN